MLKLVPYFQPCLKKKKKKVESLVGYNKISWWYVCLNSKVLEYEKFTI